MRVGRTAWICFDNDGEMSMNVRILKRFLALVLIATALNGCGEQRNAMVGNPQGAVALEDIQSAIASATGYPKDALELLASPVHLRISISDGKLAQSNQMDRENAATDRDSSRAGSDLACAIRNPAGHQRGHHSYGPNGRIRPR